MVVSNQNEMAFDNQPHQYQQVIQNKIEIPILPISKANNNYLNQNDPYYLKQ